jgi:predicted nucleic acid-binding protein
VSTQIFIDTLFVVALINRRDQHHQRATTLTDQLEGRQFLTTDAVLLEIGNALARNYKPQAIQVIDRFLSSDDIELVRLTPPLFEAAYTLYRTHLDKECGLVDSISFVVMRQAGIQEALTFDHQFIQAGFRALMRED